MDVDRFWQIVDASRARAGSDTDARVEALRTALSGLPATELESFQAHYDEQVRRSYRWDLWGAAFVMNGGCSDDGFRYFRDWLISEGRQTFERALANPESLADLDRVELAELESYGYVALELYGEKTSDELDRDFSTEGAEPAGRPWKEEEVDRLFPRLSAKYSG
ncbi:MAG: DUF4240 domain-containing protein [Rhodospirillales bacterium]|nr:DUF4240 domain-containing protein [Rhodospirillales bacterium]